MDIKDNLQENDRATALMQSYQVGCERSSLCRDTAAPASASSTPAATCTRAGRAPLLPSGVHVSPRNKMLTYRVRCRLMWIVAASLLPFGHQSLQSPGSISGSPRGRSPGVPNNNTDGPPQSPGSISGSPRGRSPGVPNVLEGSRGRPTSSQTVLSSGAYLPTLKKDQTMQEPAPKNGLPNKPNFWAGSEIIFATSKPGTGIIDTRARMTLL